MQSDRKNDGSKRIILFVRILHYHRVNGATEAEFHFIGGCCFDSIDQVSAIKANLERFFAVPFSHAVVISLTGGGMNTESNRAVLDG